MVKVSGPYPSYTDYTALRLLVRLDGDLFDLKAKFQIGNCVPGLVVSVDSSCESFGFTVSDLLNVAIDRSVGI